MHTLDDYFAQADAKSPAAVAAEAGISESTLSRIRGGKQNTTRDVLRKIIAATGGQVSADSLLGLHDAHDNTDGGSRSPTNAGAIIGTPPGALIDADKFGGNIREPRGSDSHGPFSGSPSTCSMTRAPSAPFTNPACSTGAADAA
jgi:hypothetical protein